MATFTSQIAIFFLLLLFAITFHISISSNHAMVRCNEKDRETLLVFKKGIIDHFDLLSTWSTKKDCCVWKGVHCDNITDRVTELHLSALHWQYKPLEGTQLQSFNASSYAGNPELCGDPLKKCFTEEENPKNEEPSTWNEDGDPLTESLYLGMGVGFAVGFWGICGSLFLIRKWRHTFFRFLDRLTDWLYVALMVKLNSFGKTGPPAS